MASISAEETPLHLAYVACKETTSPIPRKPHPISVLHNGEEDWDPLQTIKEVIAEIQTLTICKQPELNKSLPALPRRRRHSGAQLHTFQRILDRNIKGLSGRYFQYIREVRRASLDTLAQATERRATRHAQATSRDPEDVESYPIRRWIGSMEYVEDFEVVPIADKSEVLEV